MTDIMPKPQTTTRPDPQLDRVRKALDQKSFCTLATVSPAGRPSVAGVIYENIGLTLYVHVLRTSRKARSIAANPSVGVCVPVRKLPVGPPFTVHFQAAAEILAMDDPHILGLLREGRLKKISGHGALEEPEGCFLRIRPTGRINTYGIGVPFLQLVKDPLHAMGGVDLPLSFD